MSFFYLSLFFQQALTYIMEKPYVWAKMELGREGGGGGPTVFWPKEVLFQESGWQIVRDKQVGVVVQGYLQSRADKCPLWEGGLRAKTGKVATDNTIENTVGGSISRNRS